MQLSKWTPLTALVILLGCVVGFVLIWYVIHFQDPPTWVTNIFQVLLGGSLLGVGGLGGVNVANGAASSAAQTLIQSHLETLHKEGPDGLTS